MLPRDVIWYVAFVMGAMTVVSLFAFRRRHEGPGEFRARDNPPQALQVLWPLLFLGSQAYPFLVVVAPTIAYGSAMTFPLPFDEVLQMFGLGLWATGGALVLWAGRTLGRFMTIQIAIAKDHELIMGGPYARIRHPTYTGVILLTVGVALVFLNILLMAAAVLVVAIASYRARKEERLLGSAEGFGPRYRQYMARTGRFLPTLRRS